VENALDWSIGLKIWGFIEICLKRKKIPKPFRVMINSRGEVFLQIASGKIL
jgi:hypothetical protein